MTGFYTDPWGPQGNTLLTGDTTYNGMGGASASPAPAAGGGISGMGYASMFTSIISLIGNAQLARTQSRAQKSQLQFQADMSQINARAAERTAQSVLSQGQQQVGALTLRSGKIKSAQRTSMAANGIDIGEGNAAEVQATTDLMTEIDKNTIEANAVRSAWGYRTQGTNYSNQALLTQASADSINPSRSASSSLVGSAATVAGNWYLMNKMGAFN